MSLTRLRFPLVLLAGLVLQASVAPGVHVLGIHPDVLLAIAVAAGVAGGAQHGAVAGFAVGLAADLIILQSPVGLAALTFSLVGFVIGSVQSALLRSPRWTGPITVGLGSCGGVFLFAVIGVLVGQPNLVTHRLPETALVVGAMNAVIGLGAVPVVAWSLGGSDPARVYAK